MKNLIFLSLLLFFSCKDKTVEKELADAQAMIEDLKKQIEPEGELVHIVMFKLKPEADRAILFSEIKKLEEIQEVKDLEVGLFEDLGDKRALSDYEVTMTMSFDSKEDYKIYQKHPIHLALKAYVGGMVSDPPATYDFFKK